MRQNHDVRRIAVDSNDRILAAVAWGGAIMSGPVAPGAIWVIARRQPESLALRFARPATVFWVVVLLIYVPVWLIGLMIPAVTAEPGTEFSPSAWFWITIGVLIPVAWLVSAIGVVAALRSRVLPAPPVES